MPEGDHASKMPAVRSAGAACERQRDRLDSFGYGLAPVARQQHHRHDRAKAQSTAATAKARAKRSESAPSVATSTAFQTVQIIREFH